MNDLLPLTGVEVHRAKSSYHAGLWLFSCDECSFEANYTPDLCRFEVAVTGNPFARHVCHHQIEGDYVGMRELINSLDVEVEDMEIEF